MGGGGAIHYAFKYPELFSALSAFSPGVMGVESTKKVKSGEMFKKNFGSSEKYFEENDPSCLLKKNIDQIRGRMRIRILVAEDFTRSANRTFHALLNEMKVEHEYEEVDGVGHNATQIREKAGNRVWSFFLNAARNVENAGLL